METEKSSSAQTQREVTLLFVDDDMQLLDAFKERFIAFGYNVLVATNGREALNILKKNRVHIAILDIGLPQMDGFKLLTAMREIKHDIPSVFLTGKQDRVTSLRAFELRSNCLVEKPCTPQELDFQIRRLLTGLNIPTPRSSH